MKPKSFLILFWSELRGVKEKEVCVAKTIKLWTLWPMKSKKRGEERKYPSFIISLPYLAALLSLSMLTVFLFRRAGNCHGDDRALNNHQTTTKSFVPILSIQNLNSIPYQNLRSYLIKPWIKTLDKLN